MGDFKQKFYSLSPKNHNTFVKFCNKIRKNERFY